MFSWRLMLPGKRKVSLACDERTLTTNSPVSLERIGAVIIRRFFPVNNILSAGMITVIQTTFRLFYILEVGILDRHMSFKLLFATLLLVGGPVLLLALLFI